MSTKIIDLKTSTATLQDLLALVREGTEVILADGDLPLARLVPVATPRPVTSPAWISDDPAPEEFWPGTDID